MKKSNINPNMILMERLKNKHDMNVVDVYHFRSFPTNSKLFFTPKQIASLKKQDNIKELTSYLDKGITVVLVRESEDSTEGICSISVCGKDENFIKRVGLNIALHRLDKYLTCKQNNNSWKYNKNNFLHLSKLPDNREDLLPFLSKQLNENYDYFINRNIKIYQN